MGLSVTGGPDGISACLQDLAAVSQTLLTTAATVLEAADAAAFARLEIGGCSGLDLGAMNARLDAVLAGLAHPAHDANHAAAELRFIAGLVQRAAEDYDHADKSLASKFVGFLENLPAAVVKSQVNWLLHGPSLDVVSKFLAADPEAVDLLASVADSAHLPAVAASWTADGNPVVGDDFVDLAPIAVDPPRSLADLMAELSERNDGESGEISVSFGYEPDGVRHVIVDIPGTKSWTPLHTSDITSLATNFRGVDGAETSYERGVLKAMEQAGVTSTDDVTLVGHSEGGMIAVAAARDGAAEFHISHVVTAGAPIGNEVGQIAKGTQVLALEESHDIVPELDGTPNPDRANVTTVRGGPDHGSIGDNHHLDESYVPLAKQVDASRDRSVRAYIDSIHGLFDEGPMTTERFVITREY